MPKRLWFFCPLLFLWTSSLYSEVNFTDEFKTYYENPASTLASHQIIKKVHVIFTPGLLDSAKRWALGDHYTDYKDYIEWIKKQGGSAEILHLFSQRAPHENYHIIKKAIKKHSHNKPVFLVGHSYGGLYALTTLLEHPHLKRYVVGLATMQTPFYGSKIAESFDNSSFLSFFSRNIAFPVFNGTEEGFHALTYKHRQQWMEDHKESVEKLSKEIPIFNLTTKYTGYRNVFAGLSYLLYKHEVSDGLVELSSQRLRCKKTRYAFLDEWSHIDTIGDGWGGKTSKDRIRLFEAMIMSTLGTKWNG